MELDHRLVKPEVWLVDGGAGTHLGQHQAKVKSGCPSAASVCWLTRAYPDGHTPGEYQRLVLSSNREYEGG